MAAKTLNLQKKKKKKNPKLLILIGFMATETLNLQKKKKKNLKIFSEAIRQGSYTAGIFFFKVRELGNSVIEK